MPQAWPRINFPALALILAAFSLLVALAIQYPLSVTFPMGGDAPYYIKNSQTILSGNLAALIQTTPYPLADLSFLPFSILPLSWPIRFVWWAAASQIAVGLTLAWVLKKHFGWPAAAAGLAFWSFMAIGASRHFEDGTIAQLLSYAPMFLVLGSMLSDKLWRALVWLIITSLTHPLTGAVLLLTLIPTLLGWLCIWPHLTAKLKHSLRVFILISVLVLPFLFIIFYRFKTMLLHLIVVPGGSSLLSLTQSYVWAILLLSAVGLYLLIQSNRYRPHQIIFVIATTSTLLMLAHNNWLGFGIWTDRFYPYAMAWFIFLAAIAWPQVTSAITVNLTPRIGLTVLLPLIIFFAVWNNNARIYHLYESPDRYLRLHPGELAAFNWINQNIHPPAAIYSSNLNRHTEWLPLLTSAQWIPVRNNNIISPDIMTNLPPAPTGAATYLLFLKNREDVPQFLTDKQNQFPFVFENDSATLIIVTSHDQTTQP